MSIGLSVCLSLWVGPAMNNFSVKCVPCLCPKTAGTDYSNLQPWVQDKQYSSILGKTKLQSASLVRTRYQLDALFHFPVGSVHVHKRQTYKIHVTKYTGHKVGQKGRSLIGWLFSHWAWFGDHISRSYIHFWRCHQQSGDDTTGELWWLQLDWRLTESICVCPLSIILLATTCQLLLQSPTREVTCKFYASCEWCR